MFKTLQNIFLIMIFGISLASNLYSQPISWNKYYDYLNQDNFGKDIVQTYDNGFLILSNNIIPNFSNILLIKVNQFGQIEWERTLQDSLNLISQSVQQCSDSGFIISGYGENQMFLLKVNNFGAKTWINFYRKSNGSSRSHKIILLSNKCILSCGANYYDDSVKYFIVKTDNLGSLIWEREYSDSLRSSAFDIIESIDGSYYFCGTTSNNDFSGDSYCSIKKLNNYGDLIWTNVYGKKKTASSILQFSPNEFFIGGTLDSVGKNRFMFISKIDDSGILAWQKTFEPGGRCNAMVKDNKRNLILSGSISTNGHPDAGIVKVNEFGNVLLTKIINFTPQLFYSMVNNFRPASDNGYVFVGITDYPGNNYAQNIMAIKSDSNFNAPTVKINENISNTPSKLLLNQNYPNPFNSSTIISFELPKSGHIKLSVYDNNGKQIETLVNEYSNYGKYHLRFNRENLNSGIYFYRISFDSQVISTNKMVILK